MAMIKCPECGHDVSDSAAACPNCGYPVSKMLSRTQAENSSSAEAGTTPEDNAASPAQEATLIISPQPAGTYSGNASDRSFGIQSESQPHKDKKQKKRLPTWLVVIITIVAVLVSLCILLIVAYLITHRRGNSQQAASSAATTVESSSGNTEHAASAEEAKSETATAEASETVKEPVHNPDAIELNLGDTTFWVPGYYTAGEETDGSGVANANYSILYTYEEGSTSGSGIQVFTYDASGMTESTYKSSMRRLAKTFLTNMLGDDAEDEIKLQDSGNAEYAGMPGYYMSYAGDPVGLHFEIHVNSYLDEDNDQIAAFFLMILGDVKKDVIADYHNMLNTAVKNTTVSKAETKEEAAASDSKPSEKSTEKSSSGVTPAVKETLDAYESIMNKYCDFMEKYENASSSDALAMLNDYYEMLDEYNEAMEKLNNLDTSNMSTADYEYYLGVTTRVSKRLLEVAQ